MSDLFPFAPAIAGVLILIVGFGFHWIGQLVSLANRDLAIRIGIWEEGMPPGYAVYENAIAVADVAIGWIYGIAGIGLILGARWGYVLALVPGAILLYHSISFWFWTRNQKKAGHDLAFTKNPSRAGWFLANFITGLLAIGVAWKYFMM
jgi:hypothetical protein